MSESNVAQLIELLSGQSFAQLQRTMEEIARGNAETREILYGGTGRPGLVWTVDGLVRSVESHDRILSGNGKSTGLRAQVEQHEKLAQKVERGVSWLIALIVMQLVGVLGSLAWWIFTAVAGT